MVKTALSARNNVPDSVVSWSGFDLINAFNACKKTDAAGQTFAVYTYGAIEIRRPGWPGGSKFVNRCSRRPPSTAEGL
jgi:putative transposase